MDAPGGGNGRRAGPGPPGPGAFGNGSNLSMHVHQHLHLHILAGIVAEVRAVRSHLRVRPWDLTTCTEDSRPHQRARALMADLR